MNPVHRMMQARMSRSQRAFYIILALLLDLLIAALLRLALLQLGMPGTVPLLAVFVTCLAARYFLGGRR